MQLRKLNMPHVESISLPKIFLYQLLRSIMISGENDNQPQHGLTNVNLDLNGWKYVCNLTNVLYHALIFNT